MNKTLNTSNIPEFFKGNLGFDRMLDYLEDSVAESTLNTSYPPYNVIQTAGDNNYVIELAVAGLALDNLEITQDDTKLLIEGKKVPDAGGVTYLHRGISSRAFKKEFVLAEHVTIETAEIYGGILTIKLHREFPESMQPRQIKINKIDK
tara:strand:+ start:2668 stop:3114 length:447 start_codon:yes stop_codon:yes gene_type:complete